MDLDSTLLNNKIDFSQNGTLLPEDYTQVSITKLMNI
jgi:hypothetical protein